MERKKTIRLVTIHKQFYFLTLVGMVASLFSGLCIRDASLSFMQYFMHYAGMFVGSICFVKAIGKIHVYEKSEN